MAWAGARIEGTVFHYLRTREDGLPEPTDLELPQLGTVPRAISWQVRLLNLMDGAEGRWLGLLKKLAWLPLYMTPPAFILWILLKHGLNEPSDRWIAGALLLVLMLPFVMMLYTGREYNRLLRTGQPAWARMIAHELVVWEKGGSYLRLTYAFHFSGEQIRFTEACSPKDTLAKVELSWFGQPDAPPRLCLFDPQRPETAALIQRMGALPAYVDGRWIATQWSEEG